MGLMCLFLTLELQRACTLIPMALKSAEHRGRRRPMGGGVRPWLWCHCRAGLRRRFRGRRRGLDDLYADPGFAANYPGSPGGSPPLPGPAVLVCEVRAVDHVDSGVLWSTHTMMCLPALPWLPRGQELKTANHTCWLVCISNAILFFKKLYLVAPGLSCSIRDL